MPLGLPADFGRLTKFENILVSVAVCGPIMVDLWPNMSQMYYKPLKKGVVPGQVMARSNH